MVCEETLMRILFLLLHRVERACRNHSAKCWLLMTLNKIIHIQDNSPIPDEVFINGCYKDLEGVLVGLCWSFFFARCLLLRENKHELSSASYLAGTEFLVTVRSFHVAAIRWGCHTCLRSLYTTRGIKGTTQWMWIQPSFFNQCIPSHRTNIIKTTLTLCCACLSKCPTCPFHPWIS